MTRRRARARYRLHGASEICWASGGDARIGLEEAGEGLEATRGGRICTTEVTTRNSVGAETKATGNILHTATASPIPAAEAIANRENLTLACHFPVMAEFNCSRNTPLQKREEGGLRERDDSRV